MKLTIEKNTKLFEPITMTITLESMEELSDLYHRLNIGHSNTLEHSCSGFPKIHKREMFTELHRELYDIINSLVGE
jgi:hypothetical protein